MNRKFLTSTPKINSVILQDRLNVTRLLKVIAYYDSKIVGECCITGSHYIDKPSYFYNYE